MDLPEARLEAGGWTLAETTTETLFRLASARVTGTTRLYEDAALRAAMADSIGIDHPWRIFFVAAVSFEPPLPAGVGPAMVHSTVRRKATERFETDLRDRGITAVERTRAERVRVRSGDRVRVQGYRGRLPLDDEDRERVPDAAAVTIAGWLGAWPTDGEFRIVGGAYPEDLRALVAERDGDTERVGLDATACRQELFDLLRDVD